MHSSLTHATENGTNKQWTRSPTSSPCTILRNPLLDPLFQSVQHDGDNYSLFAKFPPAWTRREASWRKMLPSQPAIKTAVFVELTGLAEFWCAFYSQKTMPIFSSDEMRIGEVFDELDAKYGQFPYGEKKVILVRLDRMLESNDELENLVGPLR